MGSPARGAVLLGASVVTGSVVTVIAGSATTSASVGAGAETSAATATGSASDMMYVVDSAIQVNSQQQQQQMDGSLNGIGPQQVKKVHTHKSQQHCRLHGVPITSQEHHEVLWHGRIQSQNKIKLPAHTNEICPQ